MPPESSKADKVIAMFDIAGFTSIPAPIAPADLLDVLQEYLDTVFQMVESSGGTARHLNGNAVVGIWPVDTAPLSRERIGRAIVEVLVRVPTLALVACAACQLSALRRVRYFMRRSPSLEKRFQYRWGRV